MLNEVLLMYNVQFLFTTFKIAQEAFVLKQHRCDVIFEVIFSSLYIHGHINIYRYSLMVTYLKLFIGCIFLRLHIWDYIFELRKSLSFQNQLFSKQFSLTYAKHKAHEAIHPSITCWSGPMFEILSNIFKSITNQIKK